MRVAAIDCGTNSIRLLVAESGPGGLTDVRRTMRIVRLGEGVDRTGALDPAAMQRTWQAVSDYAGMIRELDATSVRMVATSASRDASNATEFTTGVLERLGVAPEVISGREEAQLSFRGARSVLPHGGPAVVVDIGGGSTEFVVGDSSVTAATSVDIGCVRMTERHLHSDPPSVEEIAAAVQDIDDAVTTAGDTVGWTPDCRLIGLAGSVTTVAALDLGLPEYDSERIHGHSASARRVTQIAARLLAATRAQRAAEPVMHPGRVDVIGAGALILDRIVQLGGYDRVLVSEHDILDGIALGLVDRAQ